MSLRSEIDALVAVLITPRVVYFPVRHHSPACALAIRRWIRAHRPRAVLVEGPDDFQPLLPHLLHEKCVPPVAIYTHFGGGGDSKRGRDDRHAAYYPLAAYSPEWVALREGHAVGAKLRFIDLDYASQCQVEKTASESPGALRIESLQREHHFQRSRRLRETAVRLGCRDHDELWDHLIEVRGARREPEAVIRDVAIYCHLSRIDTPGEVLAADGTLAREAVMARAVREELDQGDARPVLVVTGGFHSVVLPALVAHPTDPPKRHEPARRHTCLTRYAFAQLDALAGYAAGMPQPGYYQAVWEALDGDEAAPFEAVALRMLVELGRAARTRDLSASVSVADEIAALEQAQRLAHLRGHDGPAREDVWDAIRGCLVKGELGADGEAVLALARKLFTGDATGEVPDEAGVPPLVDDFRRGAEARKLPVRFGALQSTSLELYKREAHRDVSRFLHRLAFLGVPYAVRRSGPDFLRGHDLRRIIEHWDCQWVPQTDSRLIECSAYGASVEEAAAALLREHSARLDEESAHGSSAGVALLIQACLMGLSAASTELMVRLTEWMARDAAFLSVARAFGQLVLLWHSREPLEASKLVALPGMVRAAYIRACQLLEALEGIPDDQVDGCVDGAMLLNSRLSLGEGPADFDPDLFWQSLEALRDRRSTPAQMRGAAAGLMHAGGRLDTASLMHAVRGALATAVGDAAGQVDFLTGVLRTARELTWREPALIEAVEMMFAGWNDDEFLRRLPDLRLAWSDLTPRETDRVASLVADRHGVSRREVAVHSVLPEPVVLDLLAAWARVEQCLKEEGLAHWLEAAPLEEPAS